MLVIIPFCQANPFKQVARLLPSAKAAAESSAIRESAMEIGKMMLKDAKIVPSLKKGAVLSSDVVLSFFCAQSPQLARQSSTSPANKTAS
ncbi:hypothetical protein T09_4286 [Trichinella sp. T9]|nr:hypothetical protein T09_4286 [Trichinella sp. T9]